LNNETSSLVNDADAVNYLDLDNLNSINCFQSVIYFEENNVRSDLKSFPFDGFIKIEQIQNDYFNLIAFIPKKEYNDANEKIFQLEIIEKTIKLIKINNEKIQIIILFKNKEFIELSFKLFIDFIQFKANIDLIFRRKKTEENKNKNQTYKFHKRRPVMPVIDKVISLEILAEINSGFENKNLRNSILPDPSFYQTNMPRNLIRDFHSKMAHKEYNIKHITKQEQEYKNKKITKEIKNNKENKVINDD